MDSLVLAYVIDGKQIGMVQRTQDTGFAFKALQALGVTGERPWQYLDCHRTVETGVAGAIHFTHAARTNGSDNLIGPKPVTGSQLHEVSKYTVKCRYTDRC